MFTRYFTGLLVVAFSGTTFAASLDIGLSDSSARFRYNTPMGGTTLGRADVLAGFLYNDDDKYMLEAGVLVVDAVGTKTPGLEMGVGPKFYYIDTPDGTSVAMGLGGQARYKMPQIPRYFFSGDAYYAPNVVSFGDAKNTLELALYANYELLPTADVYLGYHNIMVEFDAGRQSVDETLMFGLKFRY